MEKDINVNRRYHLILTDDRNLSIAEQRQEKLKGKDQQCEIVCLKVPVNTSDLNKVLSNQPLGTFLWIYSNGEAGRIIQQFAFTAGYSRKDMRISSQSHGQKRVFCSKCHHISDGIMSIQMACQSCGQQLECSDHYSAYHHAYLGYPVFDIDY